MTGIGEKMYFVPSPALDVPPFLMKRYGSHVIVSAVRKMIFWSVEEYQAALKYYSNDDSVYKRIRNTISCEEILGKHRIFKGMCKSLSNPEVWDQLTPFEQRYIVRAYKLSQ